jgi:hypothetical protein
MSRDIEKETWGRGIWLDYVIPFDQLRKNKSSILEAKIRWHPACPCPACNPSPKVIYRMML